MALEYRGHWLRTRRQAAWQDVTLLLVLLPLAAWRATSQPPVAGIGLLMLTIAPFVLAWQAWRFLDEQEHLHEQPTPGMTFAFRFLANTPLTLGGVLFVVLLNLR